MKQSDLQRLLNLTKKETVQRTSEGLESGRHFLSHPLPLPTVYEVHAFMVMAIEVLGLFGEDVARVRALCGNHAVVGSTVEHTDQIFLRFLTAQGLHVLEKELNEAICGFNVPQAEWMGIIEKFFKDDVFIEVCAILASLPHLTRLHISPFLCCASQEKRVVIVDQMKERALAGKELDSQVWRNFCSFNFFLRKLCMNFPYCLSSRLHSDWLTPFSFQAPRTTADVPGCPGAAGAAFVRHQTGGPQWQDCKHSDSTQQSGT